MRAIAIVSGKGGVGKTMTALNLGVCLRALRRGVTLVDANISTPDIGISLGAPIVPISLQHVLSGTADVKQALYMHGSGMRILPASLAFKSKDYLDLLLNLEGVIYSLKRMSEFTIIDGAAGIGDDVRSIINAADECLIVTNPEMPAIASAMKTIRLAESLGKRVTGVVVTKANGKNEISPDEIGRLLDNPVIAVIPGDDNVKGSIAEGEPISLSYPKSGASKAYMRLAQKIISKRS